MTAKPSRWQLCDASLREGLQSSPTMFQDESSRIAYVEAVLGADLVDTVEVYHPGSRLTARSLAHLTTQWGNRVRVYCGVAHRLAEVPDDARSLSLTLLNGRLSEGIDAIRWLATSRADATIRVGLECVTRWSEAQLRNVAQVLAAVEQVSCIAICDSIGELTPGEMPSLMRNLDAMRPNQSMGGHFHDDLGLAVANAAALLACIPGACTIDVTIGGIGERVGIIPLESALVLRHGANWLMDRREVIDELRNFAGAEFQLFDKKALSGGTYVASSHFTAKGALRDEFHRLY